MSYELIHIYLGKDQPDKVKAEIQADAKQKGMSAGKFMLWCYKQWKESRKEKEARVPHDASH